MTYPDLVNGFFEIGGSIAVWFNVAAIYRDKGYAGMEWYVVAFFWSWGIYNLFYYPYLHQMLSFAGGISVVLANTVYTLMMLKFGRKN
jgi:hypothetical protein